VKRAPVRGRPRADDQVQGAQLWEEARAYNLSESPAQQVAADGRLAVEWHDGREPWMSLVVAAPDYVQSRCAAAAASAQRRRDVRSARQAPVPRNPSDLSGPRAWRAAGPTDACGPSCGVGSRPPDPSGCSCGLGIRVCWSVADCVADTFSSSSPSVAARKLAVGIMGGQGVPAQKPQASLPEVDFSTSEG